MSRTTGRAIAASCGFVLLAAIAAILLLIAKGASQEEEPLDVASGIRDVGPFKVGFERGLNRASFSGRPLVQLFVPDNEPQVFESLLSLLTAPGVLAEMADYTGVLVPVPPEAVLSEEQLRARSEAQEARLQQAIVAGETLPDEKNIPKPPRHHLPRIVIQSVRGPILSILEGQTLTEAHLVAALQATREADPPAMSPLYEVSKEDPEVFQRLIAEGSHETVRVAAEVLAEIEPNSPAHRSALEALGNAK